MKHKQFTGRQLAKMLSASLDAQCHNIANHTIVGNDNGSVSVYPPDGKETIYGVNGIFSFAEALGLSAYVSLEYRESRIRPIILLS